MGRGGLVGRVQYKIWCGVVGFLIRMLRCLCVVVCVVGGGRAGV